MVTNRRIGLVAGWAVFAVACLAARTVIRYLPYHDACWPLTGGLLLGGVVVGLALFAVIRRMPDARGVRWAVVAVLVLLFFAPPLSMFLIGRVTYARFGFTAYGLIPVPVMDVTVDAHGLLGFREKSHLLTLEEVDGLLTPEVEIVVIGTGWDQLMRVDNAVRDLPGREVRVLATPEAFSQFNALVAQGRRVVLIAHGTC